jgi:predicted metal-binding membrane protein
MTGVAFLLIWTGMRAAGAGLMVALLALGVMSWVWMTLVGATILFEKVTPIGSALTLPVSAALAAAAVVWAL